STTLPLHSPALPIPISYRLLIFCYPHMIPLSLHDRSSDLAASASPPPSSSLTAPARSASATARPRRSRPRSPRVSRRRRRTSSRSEEHTSELQSRFDLVCRLLLEKKKLVYETVTS